MYAHLRNGEPIPAPVDGWVILPEGIKVPQVHQEFYEDYSTNRSWWLGQRRCISTMTPIVAQVWGGVRAIAVPQHPDGAGN